MKSRGVEELYRKIGEAIRHIRTEGHTKMKQEDLANNVGLSRASIVNIERGRHRIQVHVLYDMARALSCKPADLLPPIDSVTPKIPEMLAKKLRKEEMSGVAQILALARKEVSNDKPSQSQDKS